MCDTTHGSAPIKSTSYRRLELERYPVPDLCSNGNVLCTDHKTMSSCTSETASVCRNFCKVCQQPVPWLNETFPHNIHGKWHRIGFSLSDQDIVEINGGILTYPSRGESYRVTSKAGCKRGPVMATNAREYSLLSTYNNGCSPRVTSGIIAARR